MQSVDGYENCMDLIIVTLVTIFLIFLVSLPLHVFYRNISFQSVLLDWRFWVTTILVSVIVSMIVRFGG